MTKICHITSAHDSNDVRIFRKECTSLAKADYEVYLVAAGESREENNVHVVGVGPAPKSRIERMARFTRKIYREALALDAYIYHLHDPELLIYVRKLKKHGKIVIFDSHEDTLEQISEKQWIPAGLRPFAKSLYGSYVSKIFAVLDAIISVTPHICESMKKYNKNIYMITNYPNIGEQYINKNPYPVNKRSLCFTWNIEEQWSHRPIIEAIQNIDEVTYILCGHADEAYLKTLKLIPGWNKVSFLGQVPHNRAVDVQLGSRIGMSVLTYSKNTGGKTGTIGNTKLFEYMMAGLPVICTDFVLWREIIDKYQCGICVPPDDVKAIENAICYLLNNPEIAAQMGANGRRAAVHEFNWETQEKKLLELYADLCSKGKR
jgi:glycosyltransferase involved in cell wall biosynthesis